MKGILFLNVRLKFVP